MDSARDLRARIDAADSALWKALQLSDEQLAVLAADNEWAQAKYLSSGLARTAREIGYFRRRLRQHQGGAAVRRCDECDAVLTVRAGGRFCSPYCRKQAHLRRHADAP